METSFIHRTANIYPAVSLVNGMKKKEILSFIQ